TLLEFFMVVQDVPPVRAARGVHLRGGRHLKIRRVYCIYTGEQLGHQAISIIAVFRPEPTPMQSTRSPFFSESASWERVIGREAGPTLPHLENVIGTRSLTSPTALMMALV